MYSCIYFVRFTEAHQVGDAMVCESACLLFYAAICTYKARKKTFTCRSGNNLNDKCCHNSLCCTQFQFTQKLAYTSWDLTWHLIIATAHVHIDKFQVLHRNERTPNFLSYVRFVNEAQCVWSWQTQSAVLLLLLSRLAIANTSTTCCCEHVRNTAAAHITYITPYL